MENALISPYYSTDNFGLIDFMDESNLDQFIDLIRGENYINIQTENQPLFNLFDQDYQYHPCADNISAAAIDACHHLPPPPEELFDFDNGLLANACGEEQAEEEDEDELLMEEDESYGSGAAAATPRGKNKGDRSRTLVSERRRRGRMKEKLYALRSLVPNITKMDKASIVGDAVLYLEELQMQANRMRAEIAGLESSFARGEKHHRIITQSGKKSTNQAACFYPITKNIFKMDVTEVEEKGYYVRVVSNKGNGVASLLYKAVESLTSFKVRSSNLAASADHKYVFTFTLHAMEGEVVEVNLQSVKVWIASVLLNQGFEFQTSI